MKMLSAAAGGDISLSVIILQGIVAAVLLGMHKIAQYLLERQRQQNARLVARDIRPGVSVELEDRQSSLHVEGASSELEEREEPPPEEAPTTNVLPFRRRQPPPDRDLGA
jgi:hypothetical protein